MGDFVEALAQVPALNGLQVFPIWIPEAPALLIIKDKGVFVSPPRRSQGQGFSIQFSAVHSRQIYQRSIGCRHRSPSDFSVENLMAHKPLHRYGFGCLPCREPNHTLHT